MKKFLPLLLAIAPLLAFSQNQVVKQFSDGKRYWEYLPPDYNTAGNTKNYTVVIFLHGQGQRGTTLADMDKITALVGTPPYYAKDQYSPFILLSPQLSTAYNGWYSSYVQKMIKHANTYRVNDIYIVGLSLGGGGTWGAATNADLNEGIVNGVDNGLNHVKGVVTVCGTGSNVRHLACNVVENGLRVWSLHGTADTTVPADTTIFMINRINACNPAPNPPPTLTLYPGENHNIWEKAFSRTNDFHLPNIYQWIMSTNARTPIANAGSDVSTSASSITLAGGGTDTDGTIASYSWTQTSGPNTATLTGNTTASLQASNLITGTYVFRLQVTDNENWPSTPDEIQVTVTNPLPVVNAGADKVINETTTTTTFTGSATDNGSIASYLWTKVSGGTATLTNASTPTVTIADLVGGTYIFRLTATDNQGASNYDDVTLIVNKLPVPNAGIDLTITLPTNSATFTGTATDPDGTISSFLWSQYEGPSTATFTNANTATVTVSDLVVGKYGFRLSVRDNYNALKNDYMTVTVVSGAREATAENITLAELETETKRCEDCSIIIYNLNGKRFYSGLFDYDQYKQITRSLQLYCYTLMRNNKKIDSGKVFQK
jgi:hypothetical protein